MVGQRDAAESDPLFRYVPLIPDVLQWHSDEITELPPGATLLAASTRYPHQAFRLGDRAWGLQFHIECDTAMIADWAAGLRACSPSWATTRSWWWPPATAVMADVEEVWQPFAARFAALALGELERRRPPQPAPARPLTREQTDRRRGRLARYGFADAVTAAPRRRPARPGRARPVAGRRAGARRPARRPSCWPRCPGPPTRTWRCASCTASPRPSAARPAAPALAGGAAVPQPTTGLRRRLVAVLGASSALGDHLVANPGQWTVLAPPRTGWPRPPTGGSTWLAGRLTAATAGGGAAPAYRLALLRIAAADLTGGRGLEQTMAALSALADATLAAAYEIAVAELPAGTPGPGWP